ncbi:MAG: NAD-binding protein [Deltaproteobacteria bacterium]|nr:NAD-binding protein [Deltaproteobacteria bacterium]
MLKIKDFSKWFSGLIENIAESYSVLREEKFFRIVGLTCLIVSFGAIAIFITDQYYSRKGFIGIFDAIYWAVVTIATVGYGDIVPVSRLGKFFALLIIISGPIVLSLITASIASILVERKIMEGKGLEAIREKDHVIICGWNENGEKIIEGILLQWKSSLPAIVLVNELDRDDVQSIQYKYEGKNIKFLRGNFVKEDVLARANLVRAKAAIVIADMSGGHDLDKADERTIFGTMAIKSMAPKVRTCAELIKAENREHLKRANVDEIIVRGESTGSLLARAAVSPGVTDSLRLLIDNKDENKIWRIPVPGRFLNKPLGELSSSLRQKYDALVLAVIREEEKIKLDDILSEDSTFIDDFIKKKFEESGKDFFGAKEDLSIHINPSDDYELTKNDWLVVISREKPAEAGFVERIVGGDS